MARAKVSFTPILPKGKFDAQIYKDSWERTLRARVKPDLVNLFKRTTVGWENKPVFRGTINKSTKFLRLLVKATGKNAEIYAMIDVTGAKPHTIVPRNAPQLVYRPGYTAATRPGRIQSRRKRRSGPIVTAKRVKHPGFEAREFSKTIARGYQKKYVRLMTESTNIANAEQARRF
jgi:hypothetical protein